MRYLLLGDLHGNLPATLALDHAISKIERDQTWFLGDAVGKGPNSPETCDWVRASCDHFIGGNWDYGIARKEFPADSYYWDALGRERMEWLGSLPKESEFTLSGIRFRLFHGRPVTGLLTAGQDKKELEAPFTVGSEVFGGVIFADSHRPFVRTLDTGYICNTGSVGNSLGVPRVHALLLEGGLLESDPLTVSILSVPYDNRAAAELARADKKLPMADAYIREVLTGIYSR